MALSKAQIGKLLGFDYNVSLTHSGGASCTNTNIKNNVPNTPTLTFAKDSAGYYKCDLSSLNYDYTKTIYTITNNIVADNINIKIRLRSDNVMEIYTYQGGVLTDNILDKTPVRIIFFT